MKILRNIFKTKKLADYEIATNPGILFDRIVTADEMTLYGLKIRDHVSAIDLEKVLETGLDEYPEKAESAIFKNGKTYIVVNGKEIEYTLEERIDAVIKNSGWLIYKDGSGYYFKDETVKAFFLKDERLDPYTKIKKSRVTRKFGKADEVIKTNENYDDVFFNTDFVYKKRKMIIGCFGKKIIGIFLGKLPYKKETRIESVKVTYPLTYPKDT